MKWNINSLATRRLALLSAAAIWFGALLGAAALDLAPPDLVTARSSSGQFIAYAARSAGLPPALSSIATNQDFVELEPTFATVSCERIKQLLLRDLSFTGPWSGNISLVLYPAGATGAPITITSEKYSNGWQYRVDLPKVVERPRYVRAIIQVLLLELANRSGQGRAAEIPRWLVEGFTQLLLASNEIEIILPPPHAGPGGLNVRARHLAMLKQTPLQQAEKKLGGRPPLTFEALSWPTQQDLAEDARGLAYRGSVQLFVSELLRLPDGRVCLQTMLARLPQHFNWQFAFLEAFQMHFQRPLDVEKWWALCLAQANGRFATQSLPLAESWQKLDQAIHTAVQVRTGTNELPVRAEVDLQTMLREWDLARQTQALGDTLHELGLLRMCIAQEYAELVQDYFQVIQDYLRQRAGGAPNSPSAKPAPQSRPVEDAILQLDALDLKRMALRPDAMPVSANTSPAPPAR